MVKPIVGSPVIADITASCDALGEQGLRVIALARSGPSGYTSGGSDLVLIGLAAMQVRLDFDYVVTKLPFWQKCILFTICFNFNVLLCLWGPGFC